MCPQSLRGFGLPHGNPQDWESVLCSQITVFSAILPACPMDAKGEVCTFVPLCSVTALVQVLFISHPEISVLLRLPAAFLSGARSSVFPGLGDFSKVNV